MYVHQTLQSKVEVETLFSMLNSKKNSIDTDKYWNSFYELLFIQNTQLTEYRRTQKKRTEYIYNFNILLLINFRFDLAFCFPDKHILNQALVDVQFFQHYPQVG